MLAHILADMNASLQPEDPPFTLADAEQHVRDYNAWIDAQQASEPLPEPSQVKLALNRTPPYREMTTARKFAYRQLIADKLEEALALAHECAGELEAEYDSLPYHIDTDGEYEFDDPDHASAVDHQRQDALEIHTHLRSLLMGSDDWFVVGWSHRFFFPQPDEVQREIKAIEAEME